MRFRRIAIRDFRGVSACEVMFAETGVTIIEGPNEVGKSSLAEAVDLLFTYADDSRHHRVRAVGPVHRDAGPEVEVELTTGPYHAVYTKRWLRRAETRLTIKAPAAESLVGRAAHDRMEAILDETLDRALYKALRFVQGDRIDQAAVEGSTTLTGALDRAAAGGSAHPEAESTLWQAIVEERARYFTATGRATQDRERLEARVATAGDAARKARAALDDLDETGEKLRTLLAREAALDGETSDAHRELEEAQRASRELAELEERVAALGDAADRASLDGARAEAEWKARREKVDALAAVEEELAKLRDELRDAEPALAADEEAAATAKSAQAAAVTDREEALAALELAENDSDFRRAELSHKLLSERVGRVERAREEETEARRLIAGSKVTTQARNVVAEAVAKVARARAARDASSPLVGIDALGDVDLTLDAVPVHLGAGDAREVTVAAEATIGVAGLVVIKVRSGRPSAEIDAALASAERDLAEEVHRFELDPADPQGDLAEKLDRRREAEMRIENAQRERGIALRDLSAEKLAEKAEAERETAETYPATRADKPPLPATVEDAKEAYEAGKERLRTAEEAERRTRARLAAAERVATERRTQVRTAAALVEAKVADHGRAAAALVQARTGKADGELDADASRAAADASARAAAALQARADCDACDPQSVRVRLVNAEKLVDRLEGEKGELETRCIELEAELRVMGAADLQDAIDTAEVEAEALRRERDDLERRARAAALLHETFARHRERARLAYVAPYREQVEVLARLVFGSTTSIEVEPADLSLVARTVEGVTVPFDSLSTGAREQLGVLARLACAILVNPDGAAGDGGVPVILDDALGYSDAEHLRRLAPAFTAAAEGAQVIVMTSTPERYGRVGAANVIRLPQAGS